MKWPILLAAFLGALGLAGPLRVVEHERMEVAVAHVTERADLQAELARRVGDEPHHAGELAPRYGDVLENRGRPLPCQGREGVAPRRRQLQRLRFVFRRAHVTGPVRPRQRLHAGTRTGRNGSVAMAKLKVTQVRSGIGRKRNQRETLRTLGLRRINDTVVKEDRPEIRGMIFTVSHLVKVEEVESS